MQTVPRRLVAQLRGGHGSRPHRALLRCLGATLEAGASYPTTSRCSGQGGCRAAWAAEVKGGVRPLTQPLQAQRPVLVSGTPALAAPLPRGSPLTLRLRACKCPVASAAPHLGP